MLYIFLISMERSHYWLGVYFSFFGGGWRGDWGWEEGDGVPLPEKFNFTVRKIEESSSTMAVLFRLLILVLPIA